MSDIVDSGVALVESLEKGREPLPAMEAVYLMSPTEQSLGLLLADWERGKGSSPPPYKAAHVFFTSKVSTAELARIKACAALIPHLRTLKELDLEVIPVDPRVFLTAAPEALPALFGPNSAGPARSELIRTQARRLATLFVSLREVPHIRYVAPRDSGSGGSEASSTSVGGGSPHPAALARELIGWLREMGVAGAESRPSTCDLLIVDRALDAVAPVIHEWTYEAMCYDLLGGKITEGGAYDYEVATGSGSVESKTALLTERSDALWKELRHSHIAEVLLTLSERTKKFTQTNKAAALKAGGAESIGQGATDPGALRRLVESLPQYREEITRLATHTSIADELNATISRRGLQAAGKVEQDVVFGHGNSKDLLKLFEQDRALHPPLAESAAAAHPPLAPLLRRAVYHNWTSCVCSCATSRRTRRSSTRRSVPSGKR